MTFKKFFGFGFFLAIALVGVKVFLYQSFDWENNAIVHYLFWGIGFVLSTALIRRLGIITFLEAIVVIGVWLFLCLFFDLIVTASIVGFKIFLNLNFLLGYLFIIIGMFFFHKKKHVHTRKVLAEKFGPPKKGH